MSASTAVSMLWLRFLKQRGEKKYRSIASTYIAVSLLVLNILSCHEWTSLPGKFWSRLLQQDILDASEIHKHRHLTIAQLTASAKPFADVCFSTPFLDSPAPVWKNQQLSLAVARASSDSCLNSEIDYGTTPGLPLTTAELRRNIVPNAQNQT